MARRISSDDRKALLADVREEIGSSREHAGEGGEKPMRTTPVRDMLQTETLRPVRIAEPRTNNDA